MIQSTARIDTATGSLANFIPPRQTYRKIDSKTRVEVGTESEIAKLHDSVVLLAHRKDEFITGLGSGVLISSDGLIATTDHELPTEEEIKDGTALYALIPKGYKALEKFYTGSFLGQDYAAIDTKEIHRFNPSISDLALIKVPSQSDPYPHIKVTDSLPPQEAPVYIVGYSLGSKVISYGKLIGLTGTYVNKLESKHKGGVHQGASGGPLINQTAEVIGIVTEGWYQGFKAILRRLFPFLKTSLNPSWLVSESILPIITYLEGKGTSIAKIRDGEPSGIIK